jgi:DNA-binding IclR family transcriptional regulator
MVHQIVIDDLKTKEQRQVRPRVQSAARTVSILLAVAQSESGLTTKEISETVEIGRQATYHLLHTLVGAGMLTRSDRSRYVLGLRVGTLAEGFARQLEPGEHLAPIVREMAQQTGETCYATGWWSSEISVLTIARGTNPVRAAEIGQGHVSQAHARASGKLLLAYATPAVRRQYLDSHELVPMTENTTTDPQQLENELEVIRAQGFSEDDEEYALGLCCLAVPLDQGLSPFALAVSAPRERFLEERERYLSTLLDAAERVTRPPTGE